MLVRGLRILFRVKSYRNGYRLLLISVVYTKRLLEHQAKSHWTILVVSDL